MHIRLIGVVVIEDGWMCTFSSSFLLSLSPYPACLPGLEMFSSNPAVQASLDTLVVGKILLMETLEEVQQNETPVVVLYDTSQEEDININSTCLKALQDKTMNNPLTVRL